MLNLREIREQRGLTQEQLASMIGVNRSAISHYEADRNNPSLETTQKLARMLDCSIDDLIGNAPLSNIPAAVCAERDNDGGGVNGGEVDAHAGVGVERVEAGR